MSHEPLLCIRSPHLHFIARRSSGAHSKYYSSNTAYYTNKSLLMFVYSILSGLSSPVRKWHCSFVGILSLHILRIRINGFLNLQQDTHSVAECDSKVKRWKRPRRWSLHSGFLSCLLWGMCAANKWHCRTDLWINKMRSIVNFMNMFNNKKADHVPSAVKTFGLGKVLFNHTICPDFRGLSFIFMEQPKLYL